jgi:hypothetical protein
VAAAGPVQAALRCNASRPAGPLGLSEIQLSAASERNSESRRHHPGTIAAIAVVVLMELRLTDPVPAHDTPAISLTSCSSASGVVRRLVINR